MSGLAGKRVLVGANLFMTAFTNIGNGKRKVSFAAPYTGKIIPLDVKAGDRILFGKYSGTEIKVDDTDYLILREVSVVTAQVITS